MKQSVSTTTIFQLVIVFTLIFSGFLALTITYNRIHKLRNETLLILEKYEGKENSIELINNFLNSNGYRTKGKCEEGEFGIASLTSTDYSDNLDENYYYCIKSTVDNKNSNVTAASKTIKYDIRMFYKFNLPFVGDILTFKITGETKDIKYYSIKQEFR